MSQTVGFWHYATGKSLTLRLYAMTGGSPVNGAEGTAFVEYDSELTPGYYEADLAQVLTGRYRARIFESAALVYDGVVSFNGIDSTAIVDLKTIDDGTVTGFTQSALTQLSARRIQTVAVPAMRDQQLTEPLIRGDAYLAEHGRAIEFSRADFPDLPGGCTATLTAQSLDDESATFSLTGTIIVANGTKVIRFEATSLETSVYLPGKYGFDVQVTFPDGNSATFVGPDAWLRVIADRTRA